MDKLDKVFVGIDGKLVELIGADKEAFLEQRAKDQAEGAALQAEDDARAAAKESALTKLQALGLSEAEAKQIVGI
jgi:hypothetical protein